MLVDAIDIESDSPVTVKIVRPEHAVDPEFRRKFRKLAEVSNALTHPNIASVTDWGEIELGGESTVFWTVDALGGGSLRDLLDRGRTLEPGQALVVGLEACRALDAAHHKGLFHTELTPSKMVFGADRRARVVDFGMARLLAEPAWVDAAAVPTHVARYASPEQALGLPIDAKTDVYALALVMIEAVTGSVPFAADSTVATLAGRVDKLMPVSADLGALASVLERAGRPEAADRFSAAEFGRALVQAAPRLAKPEPIPIVSTGQFDTTAMRRPTDPTGGVERPPPVAGLAGVGDVEAEVVDASLEAAPVDEVPVEEVAIEDELANSAVADEPAAEASVDETLTEEEPSSADVANAGLDDVVDDESDVESPAGSDVDDETAGADPIDHEDATDDADEADDVGVQADAEHGEIAAADDVADEADDVADDVVDEANDAGDDDPADAADTDDVDTDDDDTDDDGSDEGEVDAAIAVTPVAAVAEPQGSNDDLRIAGEATTVTPVVATAAEVDSPEPVLYDDAPRRRRRAPIIFLVIVLLAGLGALGYAGSLLLQPKSFEVPVLAGVPDDEALNQIAGNDWDIRVDAERSDSFPEVDTVIRTVPGPGVELEEGEAFTLVLSAGPEFRVLPELDGLPFDAAVTQLASLGLNAVEGPERVFSETVAVASVVSWQVEGDADASMQAGGEILPGETIVMTLSQGPEPRGVPNLAGQTVAEATATLEALQLGLSQGADVFSESVPAGQIVSQDLAPESSVERDAIVTVQVSKGPDRIDFPSLDGLTFSDAEALLNETGFVVGTLLGSDDGTFVEATIDGEDVTVGTSFARGQVVDVIFL